MLRRKALYLIGLLVATVACERPEPPTTARAGASYNLSAYLQQQIDQLQAAKPMILKSVEAGEKPVETIQTLEVDWADELAIFQEVDLSKPTLNEYYTQYEDTLANGDTEISFEKSESAAVPVQALQLQLSPGRQLQKLEALILQKNMLFYSRRKLLLTTDPISGNISSYYIQGEQKLIFGDTLRYSIHTNF